MDRSSPITYLTTGTRTAHVAGFTIMDGQFPGGLRMPAHHHKGPTLAVILQGSFEERLAMRTHECGAGQFVVKPPGETHCDAFSSPGRAIALEIAVESLDQFGMFVPCEATYTQNEEAHSLAWHIARELRGSPGPASLLALEGLALELIAASARPKRTPARDGPSWLRRLVEMLQDSPCDLPTVTAMAQTVDVHPAYLARVFKTYYRRSLGVFARQLRLQWAAQRLVSTTEPVAAIAQAAGFYDQSHFSRAFFAETGFTPSRYRRLFGARSAP